MTKRKLQAMETKKRIFNAANELMKKKGFDNMTIQEIQERAGVSVGTFYHYFKSKQDVFFELYRKADEYFETEVAPELHSRNLTDDEKIILFFGKYAIFNTDNGIESVRQIFNTNNKFFTTKDRYMVGLLQDIVSEAQQSGRMVSDMSAEEITQFLFIHARGVVFDWCLHDGRYDLEERMNDHFKRIVPVFLPPA
jgi:AcrR family transcriptional regulator